MSERENTADSNLESASGDCLTCSDTKEVAIRTTQKRLWKKVRASCSIARGCLWSEAQLKQIKDSHQAIWESNHEIVWTEQEMTFREDHTSFKVNKITVRTDQLLQIRGHPFKNPHMGIRGWGPWPKGNPCAIFKTISCMLLSIIWKWYDLGHGWPPRAINEQCFRWCNVSASRGLKSFFPWCLKLGGNTKTITVHLREVHYRMAIVYAICLQSTSMNTQSILDHCSGCKAKCNKELAK